MESENRGLMKMKHITNIYSNGIPNSIEIFNDQVFIPHNIQEVTE